MREMDHVLDNSRRRTYCGIVRTRVCGAPRSLNWRLQELDVPAVARGVATDRACPACVAAMRQELEALKRRRPDPAWDHLTQLCIDDLAADLSAAAGDQGRHP